MTCSAAEHLKLTAVKANCRAKGKLFICFWCVSVIFHFSQLSGIFLAQKQHTWLQKLFVTSKNSCKEDLVERKKNQVDNSHLLHTSNVWRQNMLCLHPIRTCFFLTCTCLDATDAVTYLNEYSGKAARFWLVLTWFRMIFVFAYQEKKQKKNRFQPSAGVMGSWLW